MALVLSDHRNRPSRLAASPFAVTVALLVLGFLAAPWPLHHKAHAALHGLCAQRPSHSYWLGGERLPLDARMMGIYVGFSAAAVALLALGGSRRARRAPLTWVAMLAAMIGAMAVDGTNSLLRDMRLWHPYEPSNWLRVVTGAAAGVALAVVLAHLVAVTLWRRADRSRFVVGGWREGVVVSAAPVAPLLLVTRGPGELGLVVSVGLVLAALSVLATLALLCLVLLRRRDWTFDGPAEVQPLAVQALLVGAIVMASLSALRTVAERLLGATALT